MPPEEAAPGAASWPTQSRVRAFLDKTMMAASIR
jgi:hypothetical protein